MTGRMAVARPDTRRCCSIRPTTPAAAGAGPPSRRPRAFAAASAALVRAEIIFRSCSARACKIVGGWSSLGYVAGPRTGRGRAKGGAVGEAGDGAAAARRGDGNQPPTILHALVGREHL